MECAGLTGRSMLVLRLSSRQIRVFTNSTINPLTR